jgi:alkanesulfonate monooxygenase SsuD/methylene tetrahydromethanopterin reductase-like flavin-dependent oxidoreductase (luciferase family)
MSTAVAQPRAAGEHPDGKRSFKLGFHTRISFPTGRAAGGLRDGIELFRAGEQLWRLIDSYRDAYTGTTPPRVAVSRSILPTTSPELARLYAAYDHERRTHGPAASRPEGALAPTADLSARAFTVSNPIHGEPEAVAEALLSDPAVALADEVIAFLPPAFDLDHNRRLIEEIAEMAVGRLGWRPAEPPTDRS